MEEYGLVWYSLVWHGYRGVIAGQAEKGEQRFMGGSRGRLGLPSPGMSVMSQDRDSAQAIYLWRRSYWWMIKILAGEKLKSSAIKMENHVGMSWQELLCSSHRLQRWPPVVVVGPGHKSWAPQYATTRDAVELCLAQCDSTQCYVTWKMLLCGRALGLLSTSLMAEQKGTVWQSVAECDTLWQSVAQAQV